MSTLERKPVQEHMQETSAQTSARALLYNSSNWAEEVFFSDDPSEEIVFLAQALEKEASLFADCSALTVTLKGLTKLGPSAEIPRDCNAEADGTSGLQSSAPVYHKVPTDVSRIVSSVESGAGPMVSVRITSRCCSGNGQIDKVLELVRRGVTYELQEGGQPLFTVGLLGQNVQHLWIQGVVSVDSDEFLKQDKEGVYIGDLKAGRENLEVFGASADSLKGDTYQKIIVVIFMLMMPMDVVFDINASLSLAIQKRYRAAIMTGVLTSLTLLHSVYKIRIMSHSNGKTLFEFFSSNWSKSLYGGDFSHDMFVLLVYEFSENLIMHTVVVYSIFDRQEHNSEESELAWNYSMSVTVFSIIWCSKDMAFCVTAWTEHLAHASRIRFMHSRPGEQLRMLTSIFGQLGNPVLLTTILLGYLNFALPAHRLGFNYETLCMTGFLVLSLGSWCIFAVLLPHWYYIGTIPRLTEDFIVDLPLHLVVCNVNGEAPTHRRRHGWSPKFHIYKFFIQIVWKLAVIAGTFLCFPVAWSQFQRHYAMVTESHTAPPEVVVVGAWILGATMSAFLEFIMLVVAQLGFAYPGLSLFAEENRTAICRDEGSRM